MLEMARTNLYNLIACLFGGFLAGFKKKKASNLRERIGVIKCLGCFYRKLIKDIRGVGGGVGWGGRHT